MTDAALRYLSVCSGIEGATVAWHPLGWEPAAFSEIEAFPRAVLTHHYPAVPLHGDFTTIEGSEYGAIDLLVGGTPCQDFSVAGLRAGITGDRGNLTLEFLRLAARTKPRWIVWENVPGVLSSDGGRALGAFLGGLAELGYGFSYRVLDAQYFNLAQRRARVFVVGYLGDWRRAAAVLFERESLLGNPPPRREAGQGTAAIPSRSSAGGGLGTDFDCDEGLIASPIVMASGQSNAPIFDNNQSPALTCLHEAPIIAHTLRGNGHDASEDGTGRGTPLVTVLQDVADPVLANVGRTYTQEGTGNFRLTNVVMQPVHVVNGNSTPEVSEELAFPLRADDGSGNRQAIAFSAKDHGADAGEVSPTLRSMGHDGSHANGGGQVAVAFMENVRGELRVSEQSDALTTGGGKPGQGYAAVLEPVTFESRFARNGRGAPDTIVPPLKAQSGETGKGDAAPLVAFSIMPMNSGKDYKARETDVAQPIMAGGPVGGNQGGDFIKSSMQVRRLTPVECERLQGFADDYTLVPWRGGMSPDGNRYKALGNSMAVPVMRWIGQRIALVEGIK
jgi:DNA (cytosine-5)-methyltransferase 1